MKILVGEIPNLKFKNAILLIMTVVLATALVIYKFLDYKEKTYVQTIILPPVVSQKLEIYSSDANDGYFTSWSKFVADRVFNYTPSTVESQFNDFLAICAPDNYDKMRKKLQETSKTVTTTKGSSAFWMETQITINRVEKTIKIRGKRQKWAEGYDLGVTDESYSIRYEIENGKFQVIDLNEEQGGRE